MPIVFIAKRTIGLSKAIVRGSIRLAKRDLKPKPRPIVSLPVGGLDEPTVQSILFALRQVSHTPEEDEIAELWLLALELLQITSDRLLHDLTEVDAHLKYWRGTMRGGRHGLVMFLRRGPVMFFNRMNALMKKEAPEVSATDMIEQRVVVLRTMRKLVAEALAQVQDAAVNLRLNQGASRTGPSLGSVDLGQRGKELISAAKVAVLNSMTSVVSALEILKEDVSGFGEFSEAVVHLKDVAVNATLEGSHFDLKKLGENAQGGEGEPPNPSQDDADLESVKSEMGKLRKILQLESVSEPGRSANKMLSEALNTTRFLPCLVTVPKWAKQPDLVQRRWLEYSIVGFFGFWSIAFLIRHSPLVGSRSMYDWANGVKFAFQAHILGPLGNLKNEMFDTFHNSPSIVTRDDYEVSKQSLLRMLRDFESDNKKRVERTVPRLSSESQTSDMLQGMDTLMRCYEAELKNPLWNLVGGQLARALLVQVQKLKTDSEAAMLELDQILKANELNVALVAAVPSILIAFGMIYVVWQGVNKAGPDPMKSLIPCRLALVELQRALARCEDGGSAESKGLVTFRVFKVHSTCWEVFKNRDRTSETSEWPTLLRDIIDLARPAPVEQKLKICERMKTTYTVFQIQGRGK